MPVKHAIAAILLVLASITSYSQALPDTSGDIVRTYRIRFKWLNEAEYYDPNSASRHIQTIALNVLPGVEFDFSRYFRFSIYAGITCNYAWGYIIQWNEHFVDTRFPNEAFGAGPVYLLRAEPAITRRLSISFDASGGFILYSSKFPAGGDIYNFMWRSGGAIHYKISKRYTVAAGIRTMHVSNGQGLTPHNPSYEGTGLHISITKYLK